MIVVDTNVLIYAILPHLRKEEARQLGRRYDSWAAPLIWRSEFRNVLAGCWRRNELDQNGFVSAMELAQERLTSGEYAVRDVTVFEMVRRSRCTAYDCEFVALAFELGTILVTEDSAILREFPGVAVSMTDALQKGGR